MTNPNQSQIDLWDGRVGAKWAAMHEKLDAMFAPAAAILAQHAAPVAGMRVLDIGCGNGDLCARLLALGADVTGIDVSHAMLAVAASRTQGKAALVRADIADWRAVARFDLAVSQFGLMFFADPVAAFAAIAANLRPRARLVFTCWRGMAENDWAAVPMKAIADLLPPAAPADLQAPGPFSLADPTRVEKILAAAGFAKVSIAPFDFEVCFSASGGVAAAVDLAMQIGPASSALAGTDKSVRAAAAERLRAALGPREKGGAVALGGAIWVVEARRLA
ncbi:MAG: methyltransferase domain-containing protein [Telmatospirillum sp.]|nr:methyltransferase domain-containing protein [Telmatospirillum sp.]